MNHLLSQPLPIAPHALMAFAALALGAWQLVARKGGGRHRLIGWLWVLLMAAVAITGFFIHSIELIGPFSPIHILSVVTLASLLIAIRAIRRGDVETHRRTMQSLFFFGLIVAGAFTFFPGRVMHAALFGD